MIVRNEADMISIKFKMEVCFVSSENKFCKCENRSGSHTQIEDDFHYFDEPDIY